MKFLITGGAGFIGSALIRFLIKETEHEVLNFDKLTYAGHLESLAPVADDPRYQFVQGDICDAAQVNETMTDFAPDRVMHLAAESHVDRSVDAPGEFIETNIIGTFNLLNAARAIAADNPDFLFHHISTDEVFGSLGADGFFTEETPYSPAHLTLPAKHLLITWFGPGVKPTICRWWLRTVPTTTATTSFPRNSSL